MSAPFPIIRLEVEAMKQSIMVALSEYQVQMDLDLKQAIDECCSPANIQRVIMERTRIVLTETIQKEVQGFFVYGEGRKAIAAAVKEKLLNNETFTPLDDQVS